MQNSKSRNFHFFPQSEADLIKFVITPEPELINTIKNNITTQLNQKLEFLSYEQVLRISLPNNLTMIEIERLLRYSLEVGVNFPKKVNIDTIFQKIYQETVKAILDTFNEVLSHQEEVT